MRIDYETQRLKEAIVDTVNASGLPAVCVRVVLTELLEQTRSLEAQAIRQEQAEADAEAEAAEKEGEDG